MGGILPALIWLIFWLREDKKSPEPNGIILKTFVFGMISVIVVIPFQKGIEGIIPELVALQFFIWAFIEELFKFGAGFLGGIDSDADNEPIDPMIYMITASLGFVALENVLFILNPLLGNELPNSIIVANLRFIGASLLHIVSSGAIGVALSLSFYSSKKVKIMFGIVGFIFAVVFHYIFNILIISGGELGTLFSYLSVWFGVIILLLIFEKVKSIARQ